MNRAAHGWRDLAERRCAHLVELHESGRWTRYYSEVEFVTAMRDAAAAAQRWAALAGPAGDAPAGLEQPAA